MGCSGGCPLADWGTTESEKTTHAMAVWWHGLDRSHQPSRGRAAVRVARCVRTLQRIGSVVNQRL